MTIILAVLLALLQIADIVTSAIALRSPLAAEANGVVTRLGRYVGGTVPALIVLKSLPLIFAALLWWQLGPTPLVDIAFVIAIGLLTWVVLNNLRALKTIRARS